MYTYICTYTRIYVQHARNTRNLRSDEPRVDRRAACSMFLFCCVRGVQRLSVSSRCPPKRERCSRLSTSVRRGRRWRNEPVAPRAPTQAPSRTKPASFHGHRRNLLPIRQTYPLSSMPEIRRTNTRKMSRIVRQLHSAESIMDIRTDGPPGPPPLTSSSNGCPPIYTDTRDRPSTCPVRRCALLFSSRCIYIHIHIYI